jgi:hypothetical protein
VSPDEIVAPAAVSFIGASVSAVRIPPDTRANHARMYEALGRGAADAELRAAYRQMLPGVEAWADALGLARCARHGALTPCGRCPEAG